jgi:hypothetical protein
MFTAEQQEAIDGMIAKATDALSTKNKELLGELKKARKNSEIDPEEFNSLREEKEALEAKLSDANKAIKTASQDVEKFKKLHESESQYTAKSLIDSGLTNALVEAKVDPKFLPAVKALIGRDAKVELDGDNRVAKIKDQALGDYVKAWAATDEGKHYVSAPTNSGGGSQGGGTSTGKAQIKASELAAKPAKERAQYMAANPNISVIND